MSLLKHLSSKFSYLILGWCVFVIYAICSVHIIDNQTHFSSLADAFLHGHLYITQTQGLTEIIQYRHHLYSVFPPMPAILLMPFEPFLGRSSQHILSFILGVANAVLALVFFRRILANKVIAIWISILYAFGTIMWFHAVVGSSWYFAHIAAMFFIWLMLLEITSKNRLWLIGLLIGCAYLSRLPAIFAIVFVPIYLKDVFFQNKRIQVKPFFKLFLGLLPALIVNALYNYFRFGTILDVGYVLLPIQHEFWYRYGLLSVMYIPIHLQEMFAAMPIIQPKPPFIIPSIFAMAIWFTTPAFIYIIRAPLKSRLTMASITSVIAISLPSLIHGGNGYTQFGYRYTLDYVPFLLILTALGFRNKLSILKLTLITLSIVINLWGIIMIYFLGIWGLL